MAEAARMAEVSEARRRAAGRRVALAGTHRALVHYVWAQLLDGQSGARVAVRTEDRAVTLLGAGLADYPRDTP